MKTRHANTGPRLNSRGMRVARGLTEVVGHLDRAGKRLWNLLKSHPELTPEFGDWHLTIRSTQDAVEASIPEAPCVYCFDKDPKARCFFCRGTRWMTRGELEGAPEELRKAAGF